ncbi:hypothetical protein B0H12DRAFT_1322483 [Mycena haematopus]|nr:hypothetical protein B0H12DRAFT_1322483 [Mycena haematopus]
MRPNFTCLEVQRTFRLPITLLARCPALRSLTLKAVLFASDNSNTAVSAYAGSYPTRLEHLSLSSLKVIAQRILLPGFPLDISALRSLCYKLPTRLSVESAIFAAQRLGEIDWYARPKRACRPADTLFEIHLDVAPTKILRLLSLGHLIFSPRQQALNLFFSIYTQRARRHVVQLLAAADRALPFIASVTVMLHRGSFVPSELPHEKRVDVSGVVAREMPLLVNRFRPGALLVSQARRVPA